MLLQSGGLVRFGGAQGVGVQQLADLRTVHQIGSDLISGASAVRSFCIPSPDGDRTPHFWIVRCGVLSLA